MARFRSVMHHCGFANLGFFGSPFTWFKNYSNEGRLKIWLDRGLPTSACRQKFPEATIHHIENSAPDHSILAPRIALTVSRHRIKHEKNFRFETVASRP